MILLRRAELRCILILAGILIPAGAPLMAQAPDVRVAIERFRDSLWTLTDSVPLVTLEQRYIIQAKSDRNNALLHIRLGFIALRLGEMGSRSRLEDGAGEFEWATDLQPDWPWAWYGLGLAEDRVGDSEISIVQGLQAMFGKDHLTRAANAYARSVQTDPSFVRGLVELAATALRQRINIKTTLAREALRQAAVTSAAANPEVLLYRGRVEREVGDIDSALAAFDAYVAAGPDKALGLLEQARTRFLRGAPDGQRPYYAGAALPDSVAGQEYRLDIALVANDSALAEFDQSSGERRVAFLRRFWGQRDRASLQPDGERLREHYRRLYYVKRTFQLVSANRHYDIVERYRSGNRDFDDRGLIYVRHGEPTGRASYNAPGMQLNESWYYARADGNLVFHFVAREDVQDYKLVESLFDVLGFSDAVSLRGDRDNTAAAGRANELLLTREKFSPVYSRLITSGLAGSQKYLTEERQLGRRSIALGTQSDSYELAYATRLRVQTSLVAVGHDAAGSILHVAYAIPGSALKEVPSDRGHLYPVRLRLSVFDAWGKPVAALDTTRVFMSREPIPATENLVGRLAVPVIAGRLTYRLAVEQGPDNGVTLPSDSVTSGDYSGGTFELSGVVLGARDANLIWHPAPADTVWFNPLGRFRRRTPMELYYEVYGLASGTPFQTEILLRKQGGGGLLGLFGPKKPALRLAFEEQADGPTTRVQRTVSLERLQPGRYWVEVLVKNATGSRHRSLASFEVED